MKDTTTIRDGIRISDVKLMITDGVKFSVTYRRCDTTDDGKPVYNAVYSMEDREAVLVTNRVRPTARMLNIWPGVVVHHQKYGGQEQAICLDVSPAKDEDRKCG